MSWVHDIILSTLPEAKKVIKIKQELAKFKDPKKEVNSPDSNGFSPLFILAMLEKIGCPLSDVFRLLKQYGADFNSQEDRRAFLDIKKASEPIRTIFDHAVILGKEPAQKYPAPAPAELTFADDLPIVPNKLQQRKLSDVEQEFAKKWVTSYMVPRGLMSFVRNSSSIDTLPLLRGTAKYSINHITHEPFNNFIIVNMRKFGRGLFAGKGGIPVNTAFFYGGLLQSKGEICDGVYSQSIFCQYMEVNQTDQELLKNMLAVLLGGGANAGINGRNYFNYSHLMQHLIKKSELQSLSFKFPDMHNTIATANVEEDYCIYNHNTESVLYVTENVPEFTIVGAHYGDGYWRAQNAVPAIFDKKGRYVSPAFYSNRTIHAPVGEKKSEGNKVTGAYFPTTNNVLEMLSKGLIEAEFKIDSNWLIAQDIIPAKPSFLDSSPSKQIIELRFISSAGAGDLNTLRYLLEWHQPRVDINAMNASNKNTALHYAVLKGHYYVVLYLLMQGSLVTLKNSEGKTPIECTDDIEIKEAINAYAGLTAKPAAAENSQGALLSNIGFCAKDKREISSSEDNQKESVVEGCKSPEIKR